MIGVIDPHGYGKIIGAAQVKVGWITESGIFKVPDASHTAENNVVQIDPTSTTDENADHGHFERLGSHMLAGTRSSCCGSRRIASRTASQLSDIGAAPCDCVIVPIDCDCDCEPQQREPECCEIDCHAYQGERVRTPVRVTNHTSDTVSFSASVSRRNSALMGIK